MSLSKKEEQDFKELVIHNEETAKNIPRFKPYRESVYSDYSPYGSDDYGLMLCFCRHKNDCLKVNSKDDFFSFLEGKDCDGRQETYLCGHYCLRDKASGYRGFVDGIIN